MDTVKKVAAIIVNYNMPERADALAEHINESIWPVDVYLVDNGSDMQPKAKHTNVEIDENVQTTNGWLAGLRASDDHGPYFAYWFLITSAEFADNCEVLYPMAEWMLDNANVAGVHPALTPDSTTAWKHLINRGTNLPRRTWMIDNIASLWRADWFNSIGRFDPYLIYGWGIDLETCYLARIAERTIWVDERVHIKKVTDIGYHMNRMNMSASVRRVLASRNMNEVLSERYGIAWRGKLCVFPKELA